MQSITNTYTCCLCGNDANGFGNSARPLVAHPAKCCDDCNAEQVLPARLAAMQAAARAEAERQLMQDTNVITQTTAPSTGAGLPACACCLGDQHGVDARCDKCSTMTCLPCSVNELRGLCPVCDREQINGQHHCQVCSGNVRVGQYMVYDCGACGEEFEACSDCFESFRSHGPHNCEYEEAGIEYEEEEEEARERRAVEAHVAANPYPTYGQLTAKMEEYIRSGDPEYRGNVFQWMAEYGEANHACCAVIYTNLFDDAKVKEMGQRIHDQGGFDALRAAFYVMKNFGTSGLVRGQITEYMFHGIGEWLC
jgi:hypothetical protein